MKKLNDILGIPSDEYDVFVLDDGSDDGTLEAIQGIKDHRLHADQNIERQGLKENGVMQNWYRLLEKCDGQFAFHLNDRDLIDTAGLQDLIVFLKEHPTLTGGICNLRGGGTASIHRLMKHSWLYHTSDLIQLAS